MKKLIAIALLGVLSLSAQNLTPAQKEADFRYLASLYASLYAMKDWKKQAFGVDALAIRPWMEKVAATQTDLDFYEVCLEYTAAFQDSHVSFSLPSDFVAQLGFSVDLYDDALLIDSLSRTRLPAARFPFVIGDELVSIDGEDAKVVMERFRKYTAMGNPRASRRLAAARLTFRPQSEMPHAVDVGTEANVEIRRQNGALETYSIPWVKTGTPLEVGPVPSPRVTALRERQAATVRDPLALLRDNSVPTRDLLGWGGRNPVFVNGLPGTFTRRLGGSANDFFYSGVFRWDELRIGYLRIPSFSPSNQTLALTQALTEVAFFKGNTDGLIVDVMRNPGGDACLAQTMVSLFGKEDFRPLGYAMTPWWQRILGFQSLVISAKAANAPSDVIAGYEAVVEELLAANKAGRLTKPLPICSPQLSRPSVRDTAGNLLAYEKPILVLTDDFSTSAADGFPAMMQDNERALIYGMRSNGAGGSILPLEAGVFSEASASVTHTMHIRKDPWPTDEYPTAPFTENIGVRPDVVADYMTKENLLNNGAPFVNKFVEAMAAYIRQHR